MKKQEIVKRDLTRTASSKAIRSAQRGPETKNLKPSTSNSRSSSIENLNPSMHSPFEKNPQVSSSGNFIKAKPCNNPLNVSTGNQFSKRLNETASHSGLPHHTRTECTQLLIDENPSDKFSESLASIVSNLTIKSMEFMKKDFINNDQLYTSFLALLSEVDEIFEKNLMLHFSVSRSREVFQLYMSRPGQVLLTLKSLPKISYSLHFSKRILNIAQSCLKNVDKYQLHGVTSLIYQLCTALTSKQGRCKSANSTQHKSSQGRVRTMENLKTEEKTLDISIMDLNTVPNDLDKSNLCFHTFESDDPADISLRFHKNGKVSTKARLIEELYRKLHEHDKEEPFKLATFANVEESFSDCKQDSVRFKSTSNKVPGYMRALKRDLSERTSNRNSIRLSEDKKAEWEELRKVKNIQIKKYQQESKKKELIQEINKKYRDKTDLDGGFNERVEERNLFEEGRVERKRIYELENIRNQENFKECIEGKL